MMVLITGVLITVVKVQCFDESSGALPFRNLQFTRKYTSRHPTVRSSVTSKIVATPAQSVLHHLACGFLMLESSRIPRQITLAPLAIATLSSSHNTFKLEDSITTWDSDRRVNWNLQGFGVG